MPLVVGTDPAAGRRAAAVSLVAVHSAVTAGPGAEEELRDLLGDGAHVAVDASGFGPAQATALRHTRRWGRCVMVGEGGTLTLDVSSALIHKHVTLIGSWVASTGRALELLSALDRWGLHPEQVVTDRFTLTEAEEAYGWPTRDSAARLP